jgi:predicted metal-dependent peptidase
MADKDAVYKLSKAKAQLIVEQPFYAALLCNLPFVEDDTIPTLAVDGKNVYYNAEYVNTLTVNQLKFAEAHEVMHCVFKHLTRRGSRSPKRWNVAGDYIINDMLVTDRVGEIHPDWLYNQQIVLAGKNTDGVYNLLPEQSNDEPQDELRDAQAGERDDQDQQWTIRAVQAAQAAKMMGKMSLGAQRLIDQIVQPKMPWSELLRRFVSKRVRTDRSFSRPNRRFLSQGMYLPSLAGETLGEIAIAVDCSGSISEKVLNEFASEIAGIKNQMRPSKISVYYFDSSVSHQEEYSPDDELNIRPHGGGGTAFSPVIEAINAKDTLPECCVFLTDLYCSDFGTPPDYPVLWVSNGSSEAPWGEVCMMT